MDNRDLYTGIWFVPVGEGNRRHYVECVVYPHKYNGNKIQVNYHKDNELYTDMYISDFESHVKSGIIKKKQDGMKINKVRIESYISHGFPLVEEFEVIQ